MRAYDIQCSNQTQKNNYAAKATLQMLAKSYLKLKPVEKTKNEEGRSKQLD